MKKIPVNIRILRVVESKMPEGVKVSEIAKITGMKNQNVSACLWKLKNEGRIDKEGSFYKLTSVNKSSDDTIVKEVPLKNLNKENLSLAKECHELKRQVSVMENAWREARQSSLDFERRYFDALAIIKYLENK
jgi:DNA-binding transcriptional regulator GbsR (MarR family)